MSVTRGVGVVCACVDLLVGFSSGVFQNILPVTTPAVPRATTVVKPSVRRHCPCMSAVVELDTWHGRGVVCAWKCVSIFNAYQVFFRVFCLSPRPLMPVLPLS